MARSKRSSQEHKPATDPALFTGYFRDLFESESQAAADAGDGDRQFASIYNEVRDFSTGKRQEPGEKTVELLSNMMHNVMRRNGGDNSFRLIREMYGDDSAACSLLALEFCYMLTVSGTPTKIPNPELSRLLLESHSSKELCKKLGGKIPQYLSDRQSMTEYGHIVDSVKARLARASDTFEMQEHIWYLIRFLMSLEDWQHPEPKDNTDIHVLLHIAAKLQDIWDPMRQWGGKNLIDRMEEARRDRNQRGIIPDSSGAPVREPSGKQLRLSGNAKGNKKAPIDRWMEAMLEQLNGGLSHWRFADIIVASCDDALLMDDSQNHNSDDSMTSYDAEDFKQSLSYEDDSFVENILGNADRDKGADRSSALLTKILEKYSVHEVTERLCAAADNPEFIDAAGGMENLQDTVDNLMARLNKHEADGLGDVDFQQHTEHTAYPASQGKE